MASVEKTIGPFKAQRAKDDAVAVLESGVTVLTSLEALLNGERFPFQSSELSKLEQKAMEEIATNGIDGNSTLLSAAIPPTRDAIALCLENIQSLECWIMLSVPPAEDGNNFGVSIQHEVVKFLKETREALAKHLESIPSYYSSRADVIDKLGLAKVSSSSTTTKTKSDSTGGKDGDENKTSTTTVEEEKKSGLASSQVVSAEAGVPNAARARQLVALDVKFYAELRSALISVTNLYAAVLDNVEKNYDKLSKPKGSSGGRGHMSMF